MTDLSSTPTPAPESQSSGSEAKKTKIEGKAPPEANSAFPDLNFPLPSKDGLPVLLKVNFNFLFLIFQVYTMKEDDNFKMNTVVEVIGILSAANPELTEEIDPEEEMFLGSPEERRAREPPSSLVPRLHAILVKPVREGHPYHFPEPIQTLRKFEGSLI